MVLAQQLVKDPKLAFVPAEIKATWGREPKQNRPTIGGYANIAEFLRKYSEAGGKVIVGTDAGLVVIPGLSVHYEMQMMTDLGIPPMKALQGATLWAAEALGQQKDLGSIERGKLADFTIVEGNPLTEGLLTMPYPLKEGVRFAGSWQAKYVGPINQQDKIGPQINGGKLTGELTDGQIILQLNPNMADNNVRFIGKVNGDRLTGAWEYSGYAGVTNKGTFEAMLRKG